MFVRRAVAPPELELLLASARAWNRLAACAVGSLGGLELRRDRAVHVDATEGEFTFVNSLAVEVRSSFSGI